MFELNESDRVTLSNFIEKRFGIQMPPSKKILLQTRLQKRALQLGFQTIHQYVQFLFSQQGQAVEQDQFATIISTHKTEFFRESDHFTALRNNILPKLHESLFYGKNEILSAWSAASSTGEEIYSMAITMYDYFKLHGNPSPLFKVTGTDISDTIVQFARKGIYTANSISSIPIEYHQYIMRCKDHKRKVIRVAPEIRRYTEFHQQNLMDNQYRIKKGIHIIFCRNVLIYFNRQIQENILRKLADLLYPGGFLFIGHSETLTGLDLPLEQVQMTIYKKV